MTKLKISTGGHGWDAHPNVSFWDRGDGDPNSTVTTTLFWARPGAATLEARGCHSQLSLPPSIITKAQPLSPQHQPSQLSDLHSIWNLFWAKLNPQSLCQPEITVRVATYDASDINGKYSMSPEAIANLTQNNSSWLMTKLLFKRNEIQKEYRGKGWDPNTRI